MKYSKIVHDLHVASIIYLLFGWILPSQRIILVFMIPSVQFQWLVNDSQCFLTQIEHQLLKDEKRSKKKKNDKDDDEDDDKEDNDEEIVHESFVGSMMQKCNIDLSERVRETVMNCCVYGSFLMSYCLM